MSGLMVLKERVDATEALIAIDLDNRRNDLVAFDLVSLHLLCIRLSCPSCTAQQLLCFATVGHEHVTWGPCANASQRVPCKLSLT